MVAEEKNLQILLSEWYHFSRNNYSLWELRLDF